GTISASCQDVTCSNETASSCTCEEACSETTFKIDCAATPDGKLQCVCTYKNDFSGICYESDPSKLCDFTYGCCADYFSGQ
ncbi:MAG TPA: hypothetical protein VHB21_27105, partial [Minicystis sp.]|nr:hypothetical protein [Minicystis sp.]